MSRMFVVAIDGDFSAEQFLKALQNTKQVAYPTPSGKLRRAKVTFVYRTDASGKCIDHDDQLDNAFQRGVTAGQESAQ